MLGRIIWAYSLASSRAGHESWPQGCDSIRASSCRTYESEDLTNYVGFQPTPSVWTDSQNELAVRHLFDEEDYGSSQYFGHDPCCGRAVLDSPIAGCCACGKADDCMAGERVGKSIRKSDMQGKL